MQVFSENVKLGDSQTTAKKFNEMRAARAERWFFFFNHTIDSITLWC